MGQPHKHAELIKAWADGAVIQRRSPVRGWEDVYTTPLWDNVWEQFRIKPKTIKYRVCLLKGLYNKGPYIMIYYLGMDMPDNEEYFIKWLGDWQEVEVE